MRYLWDTFKSYAWWMVPLWAAAGYLGWRIGEALSIISKLSII